MKKLISVILMFSIMFLSCSSHTPVKTADEYAEEQVDVEELYQELRNDPQYVLFSDDTLKVIAYEDYKYKEEVQRQNLQVVAYSVGTLAGIVLYVLIFRPKTQQQ